MDKKEQKDEGGKQREHTKRTNEGQAVTGQRQKDNMRAASQEENTRRGGKEKRTGQEKNKTTTGGVQREIDWQQRLMNT